MAGTLGTTLERSAEVTPSARNFPAPISGSDGRKAWSMRSALLATTATRPGVLLLYGICVMRTRNIMRALHCGRVINAPFGFEPVRRRFDSRQLERAWIDHKLDAFNIGRPQQVCRS